MLCLITYKVRSENGYGFLRPGLKTGVGNGIFWSEIGSGFGDAGGTPPPKIPRSTPPPGRIECRIREAVGSLREYVPQKILKSRGSEIMGAFHSNKNSEISGPKLNETVKFREKFSKI